MGPWMIALNVAFLIFIVFLIIYIFSFWTAFRKPADGGASAWMCTALYGMVILSPAAVIKAVTL